MARSSSLEVVPEPSREGVLVELTTREGKNEKYDFLFGGLDSESVQAEKEVHGLEGDALVAVHERVVLGEAEPVRGGQSGKIRLRIILEPVLRPLQCRLQKPAVSQPKGSAMGLNLVGVDGKDVDRQ